MRNRGKGWPARVARVLASAALALVLGGCATWTLDRSVRAKPEDVAYIAQEIERAARYQQAVHEVSTFAADRCPQQAAREPFMLLTLGHMGRHYGMERYAAYWEAGGFDEHLRVLWATPGSGLRRGERVLRINDIDIGPGDIPLARYLDATSRARDAALEGKPYRVTLEDGRTVDVPVRKACRTLTHAMPLFEANDQVEVTPALHGAIVLPRNAIHEARTEDEYRYLAGVAVYLSASEAARNRRRGGLAMQAGALVGITALIVAMPVVGIVANPVVSAVTNQGANALQRAGMSVQAAVFASRIVADMGGDALAGLALVGRLQASGLAAPSVLLTQEEATLVRDALAQPAPAPARSPPAE